MKVNSITTSPNFGKVLKSNVTFSDAQMRIAKDIKAKMNTVYDGHFSGKTPNNWLEDRKCDTLILPGGSDKSVKFCVTSKATNDPALRPTVSVDYFVGEYSENKPFFVQDIKEANKRAWMNVGIMGLVAACVLSIMFLFSNYRRNHSIDKIIQQTEIITDTLKNVVKNDTIPLLKVK